MADQIEPCLFPQNMRVDSDDDVDQTLLHLDFLDNLTDTNRISLTGYSSVKEQHHQNEAIRCLKEVGYECSLTPAPSLSHISVKTQYSVKKNAEWQAVIKADVLRKRQQDIVGDTLLDSDVPQSSILNTTIFNMLDISLNLSDRIQPITTMTTPMPTRHQVCDEFTLNDDQARAFYIVCRHADGESHLKQGASQQQLIMCIPGAGGTGKSRLINAITHYFVKTQRKEKLQEDAEAGFFNVENDWKNVEFIRGIELDDVKTQQWLTSIVIGFVSSNLLTQPFKILFFAIVFSYVCRKEHEDGERDEYREIVKEVEWNSQRQDEDNRLTKEQIVFAPWQRLKEILQHLRRYFRRDQVLTIDDYWNWLETSFAENLRAQQWYNEDPLRNLSGYMNDKTNRLIGWATMRQLRVRSHSCSRLHLNWTCEGDYSFFNEEKDSFTPGWKNQTRMKWNSMIDEAFEYLAYTFIKEVNFLIDKNISYFG